NSAPCGRAQRASTVGRAIASIGVIEARKVMLAAAMRPLFTSAGLGPIWSHSLMSASLCAALAAHTGLLSPEEGLVLGLVHDIGAVAVQFLPRETLVTYRNLVASGCPATYVERLLLGRDHGEIGAGLIAQWHFPEEFIDAVRFHHQPERSPSKLASLAYLAEFWSGRDEDLPSFGRVEDCLERVGLTLETLLDMGNRVRLFHFDKAASPPAQPSWQGFSIAEWENVQQGQGLPPAGGGGGAGGVGGFGASVPSGAPLSGSLKVVTTKLRPGYLRRNGVPYSGNSLLTEFFDRSAGPNGDSWLILTSIFEDPQYLQQPFVLSTHYKQEPDGSKFNPRPCEITPPVEAKAAR